MSLSAPFEGDRVMRAAPEEENVPRLFEAAGDLLDLRIEGERLAERCGKPREAGEKRGLDGLSPLPRARP